MSHKIKTSVEVDGYLSASQIANATTDTDKFLVSDNGLVKYRTGSEVLSDLGITLNTASILKHIVKAGVSINKGQAVYVTGADGTNMIVGLASNISEATSSKTMGLLDATVAINGFANVVTEGLLDGLNTSTANAGDSVWLGTNGNLIYGLANKPSAPDHLVFIGIVTRVNANNGEIFVKVQNGFELNEIHDVDLKSTTPSGNDILAFEGAPVNLWKNKTIPSVLGYTPVPTTRTITINGSTQDLSANRTFSIDTGVTSFNTRTGAITLSSGDVTGALGYTPYNASNPAGYISSYTETDPTVPSHVKAITTTNISNWNTAFGWGNHAGLYSLVNHNHGLGRHNLVPPQNIDGLTTTNFRSTLFGSSANDWQISTARFNNVPAPLTGLNMYGTVFAWAGSDTHGFLAVDYIGPAAIVGGGNGQNINWTKRLAFLDDTVPNNRTITINGTTQDLTANRSFTVTAVEIDTLATVTGRGNTTTSQIGASNFFDVNVGSYNVNLGSGGLEGRGLVAGYSGGSYGGIGYNVRHTTTGGSWVAPLSDTSSYLLFTAGGFNFQGAGSGASGRTLSYTTLATLNLNGIFTVPGDVRSPIFYDSNNTGYYVDPASTSNCNVVNTAGYSNANYGFRVFRNIGNVASWPEGQHQLTLVNSDAGYVTLNFHRAGYTSNNIYYNGNFYVDAFLESNQSLRAPIFYDSNDTSFYLDASSTGTSLRVAGELNIQGVIRIRAGGETSTFISEGWGIRLNGVATQPVQVPNASFGVGFGAGGGNYGVGNGYFTGDVTAYYSDKRLKHNLVLIDNAIEKVKSLNGYTYQHNELGQELLNENPYKTHAGLIAQEVQAILPEVVTIAPFDLRGLDEQGNGISKSGENYLTIKYERIVPLLIEAIKEQQTQIEELKELVNKLIKK